MVAKERLAKLKRTREFALMRWDYDCRHLCFKDEDDRIELLEEEWYFLQVKLAIAKHYREQRKLPWNQRRPMLLIRG